jgi:hypothetical protein
VDNEKMVTAMAAKAALIKDGSWLQIMAPQKARATSLACACAFQAPAATHAASDNGIMMIAMRRSRPIEYPLTYKRSSIDTNKNGTRAVSLL